MRRLCIVLSVLASGVAALSSGCGSEDGSGVAGGGVGGGKGGTGNTAGSGSSGSGGIAIGGAGSGGGGSSGDGGVILGDEEKCDGIDNDSDGVVDDVDAGKDGICDCLRIATLGQPGTVGVSNMFDAWLDARSAAGAVHLQAQVLTPALLQNYQVIVSQNVSEIGRAYGTSEVDALKAWIEKGGGFMTLIGYAGPTEIQNVNLLLAPFGMSYGPEQILQKQGASTVPVTQWVSHPVTAGVSLLGVDNGYPVNGSGTVLATEQGWNVLRVQEASKGKLVMWGDEWITFDTEWQGHPEYQVETFWLNVIKWLTPAAECQVPIPPPVK